METSDFVDWCNICFISSAHCVSNKLNFLQSQFLPTTYKVRGKEMLSVLFVHPMMHWDRQEGSCPSFWLEGPSDMEDPSKDQSGRTIVTLYIPREYIVCIYFSNKKRKKKAQMLHGEKVLNIWHLILNQRASFYLKFLRGMPHQNKQNVDLCRTEFLASSAIFLRACRRLWLCLGLFGQLGPWDVDDIALQCVFSPL